MNIESSFRISVKQSTIEALFTGSLPIQLCCCKNLQKLKVLPWITYEYFRLLAYKIQGINTKIISNLALKTYKLIKHATVNIDLINRAAIKLDNYHVPLQYSHLSWLLKLNLLQFLMNVCKNNSIYSTCDMATAN